MIYCSITFFYDEEICKEVSISLDYVYFCKEFLNSLNNIIVTNLIIKIIGNISLSWRKVEINKAQPLIREIMNLSSKIANNDNKYYFENNQENIIWCLTNIISTSCNNHEHSDYLQIMKFLDNYLHNENLDIKIEIYRYVSTLHNFEGLIFEEKIKEIGIDKIVNNLKMEIELYDSLVRGKIERLINWSLQILIDVTAYPQLLDKVFQFEIIEKLLSLLDKTRNYTIMNPILIFFSKIVPTCNFFHRYKGLNLIEIILAKEEIFESDILLKETILFIKNNTFLIQRYETLTQTIRFIIQIWKSKKDIKLNIKSLDLLCLIINSEKDLFNSNKLMEEFVQKGKMEYIENFKCNSNEKLSKQASDFFDKFYKPYENFF